MKITKKINIMLASLLTVAAIPQTVNAQVNFGQCTSSTLQIDEIISGPGFNSLVRFSSGACGERGLVCFSNENGVDSTVSNRAFAVALTAQATAAEGLFVRWDTETFGCGGDTADTGFPMVFDFRLR